MILPPDNLLDLRQTADLAKEVAETLLDGVILAL